MTSPLLRITRLRPNVALPRYETDRAAGLDLAAALPEGVTTKIPPGGRALIPTGLRIALPPGHEGQVRPRSGLAVKHGVTVLNAPGTIDEDYRGEVHVALVNLGVEDFVVSHGMRIGQLVVAPVTRVAIVEESVDEAETDRGAGGFGSTGA